MAGSRPCPSITPAARAASSISTRARSRSRACLSACAIASGLAARASRSLRRRDGGLLASPPRARCLLDFVLSIRCSDRVSSPPPSATRTASAASALDCSKAAAWRFSCAASCDSMDASSCSSKVASLPTTAVASAFDRRNRRDAGRPGDAGGALLGDDSSSLGKREASSFVGDPPVNFHVGLPLRPPRTFVHRVGLDDIPSRSASSADSSVRASAARAASAASTRARSNARSWRSACCSGVSGDGLPRALLSIELGDASSSAASSRDRSERETSAARAASAASTRACSSARS